ncbi:Ohr family peroxiredoxin [Micromonospora sp. NPDC051300]|uniref:Ohr family peroxiredoxin n=1 Tax=Micromonospora sp. NPDC051300 TaxID=3364286 RepID=UPI0037BB3303
MDLLYVTEATATGDGREGSVRTDDGVLTATLSAPPALGGTGGTGTNPEQLFAAGYAACFHSALRWIARQDGVDVTGSAVTARVALGSIGDTLRLAVELRAELPGLPPEQAEALVRRAHETCPYSAALRGDAVVLARVAPPAEATR